MRFAGALLLVALSGFIALSYEIVWVRVFSFGSAGHSAAFGLLLGAYLLGLALGAWTSLRFHDTRDSSGRRPLRSLAGFILLANAAGFLVAPAAARLATVAPFPLSGVLVVLAAALLGAILPLICHLAIPADDRAGVGLSLLYLANIVGSTGGSLVTGFVLIGEIGVEGVCTLLAVGGVAVAFGVLAFSGLPRRALLFRGAVAVALSGTALCGAPYLYDALWERLQHKRSFDPGVRFAQVVESRSGVITVTQDGTVYGGGGYDGRFGTDPKRRSWLVRPYFLSAVHPAPRRVLQIGLASGSWAQIIAHHPDVERLTLVEINAGYLEIVTRDAAVASLAGSPKLELAIDDARRWLAAHPERRFDAIVFNATQSWRAFATNILSAEFFELVRAHLAPGGLYVLNTTFCRETQATALSVFPHALQVINTLVLSGTPLVLDTARWRDVLLRYRIDGVPVYDPASPRDRRELDRLLGLERTLGVDLPDTRFKLLTRAQIAAAASGAEVITDDNMASEWRLW